MLSSLIGKIGKINKLVLAMIFVIIAFLYIIIRGGTYEAEVNLYEEDVKPEDLKIEIAQGKDVISIDDIGLDGSIVRFKVTALSEGSAEVWIHVSEDHEMIKVFYVHKFKFVTEGSRLGPCTGGNIIIVLLILYSVILLISFAVEFREGIRKDFYSHHNIVLLAIVIILTVIIIHNILYMISSRGIMDFINGVLYSSHSHLVITIPIAFIASVAVFGSNIVLLKKEGFKKKNLLGTFISLLFLLGLFAPFVIDEVLERQTLFDVHREDGIWNYIRIIIINYLFTMIFYMVVIVESTIIMSIRAAFKIPAFDRDYILILGCWMRKDGTPTPLLKGRVDAAIRFADMQKKATGKDIIFVPSGGQGSNEVMSEAECMARYLASCGINEESILKEEKSTNTYENFKFSLEKIREQAGDRDIKLAYATTGYHVFRSGRIASRNGIEAQGIGSKTKKYFWINAFIRELTAIMHYEKKFHFKVAGILFIVVFFMGSLLFISNVI